ncbi:MAG: Tse2 family ADP-ribosyltransferase toxin [Gammaproteobacteria bacterium]
MTEILKDILISVGEIDRYYEESPVNLWRAKRIRDTGSLFGLVEKEKILSNGQIRPADITIAVKNGVKWVSCKPTPRGISTFDKPNTFKGSSWEYYKIPHGTVLPAGLAIVKDKFNHRIGATHYTIAPAYDMPLTSFKKLLDQLALLVVRDAI